LSSSHFLKRRTHNCGELGLAYLDEDVTIMGWVHRRRDLGGVIFLELRDSEGIVQVIFSPEQDEELHRRAGELKIEYVVAIRGRILRRPEGTVNRKLSTGEVEILANDLLILNESSTPPIKIASETTIDEFTRLKYRYLDLRTTRMHSNIKFRALTIKLVRDYLEEEGFLEIETPVLINSTPEGARDYLVPSRVHPGKFYALPQSPQIFKQLLMVSGFERYYQIARCFRDEDLRADRQPEFTQIDIEMAFVEREDILNVAEGLMASLFKNLLNIKIPRPFPRLTYHEAMSSYGIDKPDLRYGMKMETLTDIFEATDFELFRQVITSGGVIKGIKIDGHDALSRKKLNKLNIKAVEMGAVGLFWLSFNGDSVKSSVKKFLNPDTLEKLRERFSIRKDAMILIIAGPEKNSQEALGKFRMNLAEEFGLIKEGIYRFVWIVDFPLFKYNKEEDRIDAEHHAFTSPLPEDMKYLDEDPLRVRAGSYDLVLNGNELASGSIRIHKKDIQRKVFNIMGLTPEEIDRKFGFLLEAFEYGTPPHGGMAVGFDRLVMLMAGEKNIREIIAFPKNQSASCPLTGAPVIVSEGQLEELNIISSQQSAVSNQQSAVSNQQSAISSQQSAISSQQKE